MKNLLPLRAANAQGFSLPEVTLALGIAAFGITTLLSLLPQGLSNIRKAGDVAASARISQQILGSIDQSQASSTTSKQRYYFNAYAVPVDPAGRHKDDIAYVAEVNPPATDVSLPGATNSGDAFLRRVTVKLKQTPAVDYEFDESNPGNYKLYSYVVARTGK
ncbi:MAG: Verru Chthon cassette protein [Prosthecobacter sp.]|nr:Verru Chthon cassette protein [Prosthecobacter sp.]